MEADTCVTAVFKSADVYPLSITAEEMRELWDELEKGDELELPELRPHPKRGVPAIKAERAKIELKPHRRSVPGLASNQETRHVQEGSI